MPSMVCLGARLSLRTKYGNGLRDFQSLNSVTWPFYIDLLAERSALLSEPYTKQLNGKLGELRFYLGRTSMRLTYWIAPGRRVIFLTVFAKTRDKERAQVVRAVAVMRRCIEANHIVEEE